MIDRLLNPYKNGILLKLKPKYKGIWKDIYKIFEIYQCMIQLDEYLVMTLKSEDKKEGLSEKFSIFFYEFKRHYNLPDEIDPQYLMRFLNVIDEGMVDSEIDSKSYIFKLGTNPKFRRGLKSIEYLVKIVFTLNDINFIQKERISENGFKYYEFKANTHNSDANTLDIIKQQIKINSKIKEYGDLELEKYIKDNNLSVDERQVGENTYRILKKRDKVDSVYTSDNKKHRTLELAVRYNQAKLKTNLNYNKIQVKEDKLVFDGKVIKLLERVEDLEERVRSYNQEIMLENRSLKKYESKNENQITTVSLTENEFTRQVSVVMIRDDSNRIRPVIINGKFKGVFLDQIVSTLGHMLDSEFFTINTETGITQKIKNDDRLLDEPYLTLFENKLILNLPLNASKETEIVSGFAKKMGNREFEIKPEQYLQVRTKLGSVILSNSAKNYLNEYLQIEDKSRYLKATDNLSEFSVSKIDGFKKEIPELTLHEKQVLKWITENPRGIIGIDTAIEKTIIALALKNPNEKYILVSKDKGSIAKEVMNTSNLVPINLKEISPEKLKNAIPEKYTKIFFKDVKEFFDHPNKYYFTSTSIANRIDKLYDLDRFVNNKPYANTEMYEWCSKYSNRVVDSFVGFKKDTKDEFLDWMRTHTFICSGKNLSLDDAIGLPTEKEPEIIIANMDKQVSKMYENISNEIISLIKQGNKDSLPEKLDTLNTLLNNPQKALDKLGYKEIKVSNPKIEKAIKLASKNKCLFFTEDNDLAKLNAMFLSDKIPGYHAYIKDNQIDVCEYGYPVDSVKLDKFKNIVLASLTAKHTDLENLDLENYTHFVHLDRGNYSLDILEERSKIAEKGKEIYIDATTENPTLDKVFQEMTLEQKTEIESLFLNKTYPKVNPNLEGLAINKDLMEAIVSASPSVYNMVQKRIMRGKKEPLLYKAYLDPKRREKLEKNNPHIVAKIRSAALQLNVSYENLLDLSCLTSISNPITGSNADDSKIEIKEQNGYQEITVSQRHYMLGEWDSSTDNTVVRKIKVKDGSIISVENKLLTTTECSPKGLGTKAIFTQYKVAIRNKVESIKTYAAGDPSSFDDKGKLIKENFIGYYVWPKLGYNANILSQTNSSQTKELLDSLKLPQWQELLNWLYRYTEFSPNSNTLYISDVYSCSVDGVLLGQKWWKENGFALNLTLDTNPQSISYRIINSYFKKKCDEEGYSEDEYLVRDLPPFNIDSLRCWNNVISNENFLGINNNNINETVNLYNTNLIKALIKETSNYPFPMSLQKFLYLIYKSKNTTRKKAIFKAIPESIFKQILKKIYEQEKEERSNSEILDVFFEDIENGRIKISSDNSPKDTFLLDIAEDNTLDSEWIKVGLSLKAKALKKEITESDPLIKNKVK